MRTTNTIEITVNGEPREILAGQTIGDLLRELGLRPELVVVEHNREILPRAYASGVEIQGGDVLELVHFVGGG